MVCCVPVVPNHSFPGGLRAASAQLCITDEFPAPSLISDVLQIFRLRVFTAGVVPGVLPITLGS